MKILVAIDFSPASPQLLSYAAKLGQRLHGELHLLHVLEPLIAYDVAGSFPEEAPALTFDAKETVTIKRLAEQRLELLAHTVRDKWTGSIITGVTDEFDTQEALQNYASEHDMDLVILGNHCRSFLSSLFAGSIAEEMIRHSTIPVLIIPILEHK